MDLLETIKNDNNLHKKVMRFCDIEIYSKYQKPDDINGTMVWNIDGMAFGCDASGGEYILLDDKSIGFYSSEGESGRIAENITELFELLINCSCWMDYLFIDLYKSDEMLKKYTLKMEMDNKNNESEIQNELFEKLSINKFDNIIELLKRFYRTAIREPQYIYTFTEEDGSKTISEGCIISRPCIHM